MIGFMKAVNWLLNDFQVQIVGPLSFVCFTYYKMSAGQRINNAKILDIGKNVDGIKGDMKEVKHTLESHTGQIKDVEHEIALTKVELQNKWESWKHGKGEERS